MTIQVQNGIITPPSATLRVSLNIGPSARDCMVTCEVTRDDSTEPAGYAVELISSDAELDYEWEQVELEAIDEAKRIWAGTDRPKVKVSDAAYADLVRSGVIRHREAIEMEQEGYERALSSLRKYGP